MKAALVYVKRCPTWRLLPVAAGGKIPLLKDWPSRASNDPEVIAQWLEEYPGANIGVACGEASGFFVLDVDPRHGGADALAALEAEHGPLPRTVQAATPSGGSHYLFRLPSWAVTNSASKLGPGLDVRGNGGQIVIAPSSTAAGVYRWVNAPWDTEIAEPPAWLLEAMRTRAAATAATPVSTNRGYFPRATPDVLEAVRAALEEHGPAIDGQGGGLHTVHAAAIATHDFALDIDEAWGPFCEWNETCVPPWPLDGGTPDQPDLRIMLSRGLQYGKFEYGCKRPLDEVETVRRLIAEHLTAPSEAGMLQLIERSRVLVSSRCTDPARRELIEQDLQVATGRSKTALGLPKVRARIVREVTKSPDRYGFKCTEAGVPHSNLSNAACVLEAEKPMIWLNEFTGKIQGPLGEWSDAEDIELAKRCQRSLGMTKLTPQVANQAVSNYASANSRDPVRERLESLEWDGGALIETFFIRAFGAADNEYTRGVGANFWKALVARALMPGCKADQVVVLEGPQGKLKSTGCRAIVGDEYFGEASEPPTSKDFCLSLQGLMLMEWPELDAMSKVDVTAIKRVVSCQSDRFRAPYARAVADHPRRCVFIGTTNTDNYLKDQTGNRRFLPIATGTIDIPWITAHREQLFAEAVSRVKAGETWWELPTEAALAEQEARRESDPWEEPLATFLAGQSDPVRVSDLLNIPLLIETGQHTKQQQMRVADILRKLGFVRSVVERDGQTCKVWKRP